MTDPLTTLLRDAADADLDGVRLERPGPVADTGRTPSTWLLAAAASVAVLGGALWWLGQPSDTRVQVGDDGAVTTTTAPSGPAVDLAAALDATMSSAWNAPLLIDGSSDVVSFSPPDRYRLTEEANGDVTVWIGDRSWQGIPLGDGGFEWVDRDGSPNPFGRVFAELGRPRRVARSADGAYLADVDPEACTGGSGASVSEIPTCTVRVDVDLGWITRLEIPGLVGNEPVVLEPTPAESPVDIAVPELSTRPDSPSTTAVATATPACTLVITLAPGAEPGTRERVGDTLKQRSEMGGDAATPTALARAAAAITGVASVDTGSFDGCNGALGIQVLDAP